MLKNIGVGEYLCTICGCMNSHTKECSCQHDGGYMSDCKCTTKNKLSLYDQLNYINERGFYSVVKDKWDDYYVVSTKSFSGAFFVTEPHIAIDAAKHQVGNSKEYQDYLLDQMADAAMFMEWYLTSRA